VCVSVAGGNEPCVLSSFVVECRQRLDLQFGDEREWHGDCVRVDGEGSARVGSAQLHAADEAERSHGHRQSTDIEPRWHPGEFIIITAVVVAVVVECIYELYVFSHLVATSSAECNCCSPLLWAAVDNTTACP